MTSLAPGRRAGAVPAARRPRTPRRAPRNLLRPGPARRRWPDRKQAPSGDTRHTPLGGQVAPRLGGEPLPPVLPVVLYNGDRPWRSASQVRDLVAPTGPALAPFQPLQRHVVHDERRAAADDPGLRDLTRAVLLLEQSRSAGDLANVAGLLSRRLNAKGHDELRRAFADWLVILLRRLEGGAGAERPHVGMSLEEVTMTLEERVAEWPKPYIEQGISLGREEGIAHERGLRRRMAGARFGAATADRLARALAAETDPERLAVVGEAIVRCATGDELLREVGSA